MVRGISKLSVWGWSSSYLFTSHGEDLFKRGHVCAVGARGRPHWPRYGRNGRSNLRCSIRPDGKEESIHGKRGGRGRRLRSRIPQRRRRGTQHRFASSTGANACASFIPKGAARAALSVHSIGPGNLRGGARGGAAGENSGAHLGARRDHRIRRTPLGILLGLRMGRFGLHLPTTPSARARIRVGHECSDLDRRSRLGNDGLSRLVVRHQGRQACQTERS